MTGEVCPSHEKYITEVRVSAVSGDPLSAGAVVERNVRAVRFLAMFLWKVTDLQLNVALRARI
uniref:hypothetical protein n=1 Tax=Acetobacter nitrogenifigens TaxID=285268 RepID=UPI0003FE2951|nr:hypothetical protein [Acetobacter nitrogenifigens]